MTQHLLFFNANCLALSVVGVVPRAVLIIKVVDGFVVEDVNGKHLGRLYVRYQNLTVRTASLHHKRIIHDGVMSVRDLDTDDVPRDKGGHDGHFVKMWPAVAMMVFFWFFCPVDSHTWARDTYDRMYYGNHICVHCESISECVFYVVEECMLLPFQVTYVFHRELFNAMITDVFV